jgi:hypothetical protein
MGDRRKHFAIFLLAVFVLMQVAGCAPGNERWDEVLNPDNLAGFWAGVWHGFIIIVTFIVSLFTRDVGIYEPHNTGWPYNLGFLLGLCISIGGGIRSSCKKSRKRKKEKDWQKIGEQVEEKVRKGIKTWLDESKKEEKKKEWEEIGTKIEEHIKKALKEWFEEE